jgi:hypothetical protein
MSNRDDLATTLARELHQQVDTMDSSLLLGEVQVRARSIQRRRATAAVAGTVLAVALVVPAVSLLDHSGNRVSPAPGPATTSPTPSPSADGQQPPRDVLDVSDLPTGAPPRMFYVQDGALQLPDGEGDGQLQTHYTPNGFVSLNDGARVWQTVDHGTPYVEIEDADGGFHDPVRSDWGLTVNQSHTVVAWLDPSGQVVIWEGRATEPRPLGDPVPGADLRLGPVIGQGVGADGGGGPGCSDGSCTVYVNAADSHRVWEVSDTGTQQLTDGGYLVLNDQSEAGLSIGLTRITDFGSCSRLQGGGEFQGFKTCENELTTFSPDGGLILAEPPYSDGLGAGAIAMFDLDGHRVFERHSTARAQAVVTSAVWEDDAHVLATMFQAGKWSVVRIASDGSMEYAVPPIAGQDLDNPFVLPTGGGF